MFRVTNKWGNRTNDCLEHNYVCCGWNMGLSHLSREEILENYPEASRMAIKFTEINPSDIILMPVLGGVAIGEVLGKKYREDLEWKDTLEVKWLTKYYPRKDLSSRLQTSLKYRGTFLNLERFRYELSQLVKSGFNSADEMFRQKQIKLATKSIVEIKGHLNDTTKLKFQDREFEDFIAHLFELNFNGLTAAKNSQQQESRDGKDLTLSLDFEEFGLNVSFNIQVKHHRGNADTAGIIQILKSKSTDPDPFTKNVLVTTGIITDEMQKLSEENEVYLFGPEEIAEMIFNNFSSIDKNYISKLNLVNTITAIG